ncbi:MAG: hypothetical protein WBW14_04795 [Candidatus Acidiferrum sp.]
MASYWPGIACVVMTVILRGACGPGDLANPGAGKWGRDHLHYVSPRSGVHSVAVHRRGPDEPVAQQSHDAFFCE